MKTLGCFSSFFSSFLLFTLPFTRYIWAEKQKVLKHKCHRDGLQSLFAHPASPSHEGKRCFSLPRFFSLCVRGYCSRSRIRSQRSGTRTVITNRGMSCRSSEVRMKHALAGMKGHSHLVIWVNYKCCRPQGGKMSWTAVSAHTHTHTHRLYPCSALSTASRWTCYKISSLLWQPRKFLFSLHFSFKPFMEI